MSRIRTIKPEFPHSESIGRLSRDARLLFILLWTFVDDHGKSRASPKMLASLLYPYDTDISDKIAEWLGELELNGHIVIYDVDGSRYLKILNWEKHQKIHKPGKSRLPDPVIDEESIPEIPPENSESPENPPAPYLGPRTLDLGPRIKTEAKASDACASDRRAELFERGLEVLAQITGKPPNHRSLRPLLGKWLKDTEDDASRVLAAVDAAAADRVAEPIAWIEGRLRHGGRPLESDKERRKRESREALAKLGAFGEGRSDGDSRSTAVQFLSRTRVSGEPGDFSSGSG